MSIEAWSARVEAVLDRLGLAEEDPAALGAVRIALVSVFSASLLAHLGAVDAYFSNASVLDAEAARHAFEDRLSILFWVDDPGSVRVVFAVGVLAHIGWLVGWRTRGSAFVAWVVWVSLMGRQPWLYSMPDQLQMALCTWLMLMPAGRAFSVDARRGRGGPVPVWCRRIIQLQLAVMYTSTGLLKTGETWGAEGTAIYYALSNPYNRYFDAPRTWAALQPWLLRPTTWLVRGWECGFGVFVGLHWLRGALGWGPRWDVRLVFLGIGIAMHVGIAATLYVEWFSPLALASYLAFVRPEELRRALDRLPQFLRARIRSSR